ncbi:MAG: thioesterase family protein [Eggerthellaceae bacterium]|nr:thioesterase family protein [Eggerthellaceae bacterium]
MLEIGISHKISHVVTAQDLASAIGSGAMEVFATPRMIALMEQCAFDSVQPDLEEGQSTVGTKLDVSHVAATPVGATVEVKSKLIEIDRKRLVFHVEAYACDELIGTGTHERFIIAAKPFMEKARAKLQ